MLSQLCWRPQGQPLSLLKISFKTPMARRLFHLLEHWRWMIQNLWKYLPSNQLKCLDTWRQFPHPMEKIQPVLSFMGTLWKTLASIGVSNVEIKFTLWKNLNHVQVNFIMRFAFDVLNATQNLVLQHSARICRPPRIPGSTVVLISQSWTRYIANDNFKHMLHSTTKGSSGSMKCMYGMWVTCLQNF